MEKRICLFCNEAINGRSDKKFCSDLCRNAHNNKLNSNENNYVRNLILMLRKNRRILQHVLTSDKITLAKQKLLDLGFNFKTSFKPYSISLTSFFIDTSEALTQAPAELK